MTRDLILERVLRLTKGQISDLCNGMHCSRIDGRCSYMLMDMTDKRAISKAKLFLENIGEDNIWKHFRWLFKRVLMPDRPRFFMAYKYAGYQTTHGAIANVSSNPFISTSRLRDAVNKMERLNDSVRHRIRKDDGEPLLGSHGGPP